MEKNAMSKNTYILGKYSMNIASHIYQCIHPWIIIAHISIVIYKNFLPMNKKLSMNKKLCMNKKTILTYLAHSKFS